MAYMSSLDSQARLTDALQASAGAALEAGKWKEEAFSLRKELQQSREHANRCQHALDELQDRVHHYKEEMDYLQSRLVLQEPGLSEPFHLSGPATTAKDTQQWDQERKGLEAELERWRSAAGKVAMVAEHAQAGAFLTEKKLADAQAEVASSAVELHSLRSMVRDLSAQLEQEKEERTRFMAHVEGKLVSPIMGWTQQESQRPSTPVPADIIESPSTSKPAAATAAATSPRPVSGGANQKPKLRTTAAKAASAATNSSGDSATIDRLSSSSQPTSASLAAKKPAGARNGETSASAVPTHSARLSRRVPSPATAPAVTIRKPKPLNVAKSATKHVTLVTEDLPEIEKLVASPAMHSSWLDVISEAETALKVILHQSASAAQTLAAAFEDAKAARSLTANESARYKAALDVLERSLTEQAEDASNKMKALRAERDQMAVTLAAAQERAGTLEMERDFARCRKDEFAKSVEELELDLHSAVSKMQGLEAELLSAMTEHSQQVAQMEKTLKDSKQQGEDQVKRLSSQLAASKNAEAACSARLVDAEMRLRNEHLAAEAAARRADDAQRAYDAALHERNAAIREREELLLERDRAVVQRDAALLERDKAKGQRDAALLEREEAVRKKEAVILERETAKEEAYRARQEAAAASELLARLSQQEASSQQALEAAKQDAKTVVQEAETKAKGVETELGTAREMLAVSEGKRAAAEAELARLAAAAATSREEAVRNSSELEELKRVERELRHQLQSALSQVESLHAMSLRHADEAAELQRAEIAALTAAKQAEALQAEVGECQAALARGQRALAERDEDLDELMRKQDTESRVMEERLAQYRHRLQQQEDALRRLQLQHSQDRDAGSRTDRLESRLAAAEGEVEQLGKRLRAAQAEAAGLEQEVLDLRQALQSQRAAIAASEAATREAWQAASVASASADEQAVLVLRLREEMSRIKEEAAHTLSSSERPWSSTRQAPSSDLKREINATHLTLAKMKYGADSIRQYQRP